MELNSRPPFHRLPLGRFADSSPSSSRTLDTTYGFDSVWIISMGHQRFIFRSPFQLAPAWLFSSYSRPASLGPQPHCLVLKPPSASRLRGASPHLTITATESLLLSPFVSCRTISVIHRRLKPLGVALSIRCGTSSAQEIHLCARLRGPHVPHLTAKGHIAFVRMLYANHDDERDSAVSVAATMRAQCYFVNEELDAPTTKALLRRAFVAVGASYHFCVFSISAGAGAFGYYRSPYMVHKMRGLERMWPGNMIAGTRS